MDNETRIIEVGGVKLEVDLRHAKTVEKYRIGDRVKVLIKGYADVYDSYPGVIIGFDAFTLLPTILLAYFKVDYSEAKVVFVTLNRATKDVEICPMVGDQQTIEKAEAVKMFEQQIERKKVEVRDLEMKRDYFLQKFGAYFEGGSK